MSTQRQSQNWPATWPAVGFALCWYAVPRARPRRLTNAGPADLIAAIRTAVPADIPVLGGTGATTARQVEELQRVAAIPMKTSPITGPSCCLPENLHDGIVAYPQESRSGFLSYGRRKGIWTTHSGEDVTFYFFDLLERVNP